MTPIYLDYNATTPVDPRVVEALLPYLQTHFGNPASASHVWGWSAERAVQKARQQVADLLTCEAGEIFFTSGSTESNNWALRGIIEDHFLNHPGEKFHVLTSNVEHNSVLKPLLQLQKLYPLLEVEWIPVTEQGIVDVNFVRQKIKATTRLMSFIWINNEIGSINPVPELADLAHQQGIIFHTDATQAVGKIPIDFKNTPIDLLSLSAHKMYGPKGVGALVVRKNSAAQIQCLICGGGQERGQRSGTLNVPGIVGLGEACRLAKEEMHTEIPRALAMQNMFWKEISSCWPEARLNGSPISMESSSIQRSPFNLSVTFPRNFPPGGLQDPHLGVSSTSACSTGSTSVSHVLSALGRTAQEAQRTLRLSFGKFTTESDLKEAVQRLRQVFDRTEVNFNK